MSAPKPLDAFAVRIAATAALVAGLTSVYRDDERTRVHPEPLIEKLVNVLEAGGVLDLFNTCRDCLLPHGTVIIVRRETKPEPSPPPAGGKN